MNLGFDQSKTAIQIDDLASSFYRCFRSLRILRAHVAILFFLLFSSLIVWVTIQFLLFLNLRSFLRPISVEAMMLFVSCCIIGIYLIGCGINGVLKGTVLARVQIVYGVWLTIWSAFKNLFTMPRHLGLVEPMNYYWPTSFIIVLVVIIGVGFYVYYLLLRGLVDVAKPFNVQILRAQGYGNSWWKTLLLLIFGPLFSTITTPRVKLWLTSLSSLFFTGWGWLWVYSVPFTVSYFLMLTESRTILLRNSMYITGGIILIFIVFGSILIGIGQGFSQWARRVSLKKYHELRREDVRQSVVFLRSFKDDHVGLNTVQIPFFMKIFDSESRSETLEEILIRSFSSFAPVIAIGNPKDQMLPIGASRLYLENDEEWKQVVVSLLVKARLIVLAIDETEGLLWELDAIRDNNLWKKTIVIFPPLHVQSQWNEHFVYRVTKKLNLGSIDFKENEASNLLAVYKSSEQTTVAVTSERITESAYYVASHQLGEMVLANKAQ